MDKKQVTEVTQGGVVFNINLTADPNDPSRNSITFKGETTFPITDPYRDLFDIQDTSLKSFVENYWGLRPNRAYVNRPGGPHKLFESNGWDPVSVTVRPHSAVITNIRREIEHGETVSHTNNTNTPQQYHDELSVTKTKTESVTKFFSNSFTVKAGVQVNAGVPGSGSESSLSFAYTHAFGKEYSNSESETVSKKIGTSPLVQPGQTLRATLNFYKVIVEFDVIYQATLSGGVATSYSGGYKGYYYWWHSINRVLNYNNKAVSLEAKSSSTLIGFNDASITLDIVNPNGALANKLILTSPAKDNAKDNHRFAKAAGPMKSKQQGEEGKTSK